ncbi:hypothetical protein Acr_00g0052910 [Actinidia rufa]|uniref:Uncharacterized protein n=1 Tax=Actinidia rufa TaxID=165716 RepID=A0A7J0DL67_9ERIC|nr:hypothetical protein Acr_00g0052910 [Actinidia rufa]
MRCHAYGGVPTRLNAPREWSYGLSRAWRTAHALPRVQQGVHVLAHAERGTARAITRQKQGARAYTLKVERSHAAARVPRQCPISAEQILLLFERGKMAEHSLGSMILLSATNYAIWKPRMEDILFCKNLHDPLKNKGDKPVVMEEDEQEDNWANQTVHWTRGPSFRGKQEKRLRSRKKSLQGDCPKYKAHDQSSDTAATVVIADEDESDVLLTVSEDEKSDCVLDSGSAYHLCRDREGCSFDASGGTLRVSKENKEILWGKKTGGLYRLEESVQTGGATVRHGSSGISKKSGQGKQPLHRGYVRKSGQTRVVQPVQDVYREAQRKKTKSILRSCIEKGAVMPKHLGEKMQALQYGGAYTSVESGVAPLMSLSYLGCCLAVLWGSWIRCCQEGQLEDIGLPSSGLEGEIVESSPSG